MRSSVFLAALGAAGLAAAQTTITSDTLVPVSTIVVSSPTSTSSVVVTVTPSSTSTATTTTVSSPSNTSNVMTSTSTHTASPSSVPSAAAGKVPLQGSAVGLGVFAAIGMALL